MSILLLGARFPQNGSPLSCIIRKDCRVIASYETGTGIMRCEDFTAIELPPHGRLIDAEALLESIKEAKKEQPEISDVYDEDYFAVAEWVAYAPTIIESEHVRCG